MMTVVVNIRACSRFDVYCGRRAHCPAGFNGLGADGYFGNPFWPGMGVAEFSPPGGEGFVLDVVTRRDAIEAYRLTFEWRIVHDPEFAGRVRGLAGKTLGCWCIPLPCHVSEVIVPWVKKQLMN